jgi:hypothetical protein
MHTFPQQQNHHLSQGQFPGVRPSQRFARFYNVAMPGGILLSVSGRRGILERDGEVAAAGTVNARGSAIAGGQRAGKYLARSELFRHGGVDRILCHARRQAPQPSRP